jgi:hypothetical protein
MGDYTPIRAEKLGPVIDRTYRDSGPFQWIREVERNAAEAGAKDIQFLVEWQGVENSGVFRALVVDNGCGMSPDDLRTFFSTFGGGGKSIGEANENFGIGAKTSLMTWNGLGLVVISWQDGEAAMIRIERTPDGEYGLRQEDIYDGEGNKVGRDDVYAPYNDEELGIDFSKIKPKIVKGHATVLIMLGNEPGQHTYYGDPRDKGTATSVASYLESRLYDSNDSGEDRVRPRVLTLEGRAKLEDWPQKEPESYNSRKSDIRTRTIKGLEYWIKGGTRKDTDLQSGVVDLGTAKAHWFLQDKLGYAGGSYSPNPGGVCVRLGGEVFYLTDHHARMRSFGLTESDVRKRTWVVIEPEQFTETAYKKDHGHFGVFMKADRTSLAWGGNYAAHDLTSDEMPWADWGDEFARQMPEAIAEAIRQAKDKYDHDTGGSDDRVYARVKQRIAARLNRIKRYIADPNGTRQTRLDLPGNGKRKPTTDREDREEVEPSETVKRPRKVRSLPRRQGTERGTEKASRADVRHGLPEFVWRPSTEFDEPWVLARFDHNDGPNGTIRANQTHPTVLEAISYHQDRMSRQDQGTLKDVERIVRDQFETLALATVVNAEQFRGQVADVEINERFRSQEALTTALIGIMSIDAMAGPMLGTIGKTIKAAA